MTQETLGNALGVDRSMISSLERGRFLPRGIQLRLLSNHLNVTSDYLLGIDYRDRQEEQSKLVELKTIAHQTNAILGIYPVSERHGK